MFLSVHILQTCSKLWKNSGHIVSWNPLCAHNRKSKATECTHPNSMTFPRQHASNQSMWSHCVPPWCCPAEAAWTVCFLLHCHSPADLVMHEVQNTVMHKKQREGWDKVHRLCRSKQIFPKFLRRNILDWVGDVSGNKHRRDLYCRPPVLHSFRTFHFWQRNTDNKDVTFGYICAWHKYFCNLEQFLSKYKNKDVPQPAEIMKRFRMGAW